MPLVVIATKLFALCRCDRFIYLRTCFHCKIMHRGLTNSTMPFAGTGGFHAVPVFGAGLGNVEILAHGVRLQIKYTRFFRNCKYATHIQEMRVLKRFVLERRLFKRIMMLKRSPSALMIFYDLTGVRFKIVVQRNVALRRSLS